MIDNAIALLMGRTFAELASQHLGIKLLHCAQIWTTHHNHRLWREVAHRTVLHVVQMQSINQYPMANSAVIWRVIASGLNHLHRRWRWSGPGHFQTVYAVWYVRFVQPSTRDFRDGEGDGVQKLLRTRSTTSETRWTHLVTFQLHQRAAARRSNMVKWSSPGAAVNWIIPAPTPGGQPSAEKWSLACFYVERKKPSNLGWTRQSTQPAVLWDHL